MRAMPAAPIALCVAALALGACGTTPKASFYTLSPVALRATAQSPKTAAAYSIAVGPVHVPELVDRPQLVIRKGANQVDVLEQHRWAQPLRAEIAQAVSAGLAARLPHARVSFDNDAASQNADYRISVDVKRFEAVPGDAVLVQAIWMIRAANATPPTTGQSTVREAVRGNSYDDVAAAFARAVTQTSNEIADAVSSLKAPGTGR